VTWEIFEREASHYEGWYETPRGRRADQAEQSLLAWLLGWFPGARRVLEVGSGTGHFTKWLAARGFSVIGLDRSPAMLRAARTGSAPPLLLADAHRLPVRDGAVDVVVLITPASSSWSAPGWPFRRASEPPTAALPSWRSTNGAWARYRDAGARGPVGPCWQTPTTVPCLGFARRAGRRRGDASDACAGAPRSSPVHSIESSHPYPAVAFSGLPSRSRDAGLRRTTALRAHIGTGGPEKGKRRSPPLSARRSCARPLGLAGRPGLPGLGARGEGRAHEASPPRSLSAATLPDSCWVQRCDKGTTSPPGALRCRFPRRGAGVRLNGPDSKPRGMSANRGSYPTRPGCESRLACRTRPG